MFEGIGAALVWDGGDEVRIPEKMGSPRPGQMDGTTAERLTELSGRVCYDSMGSKQSRNSAEYIDHILQVGHFSIAEHFNATLEIESADQSFRDTLSAVMINRPGTWTSLTPNGGRVTLNCRTAMEFDRWSKTMVGLVPGFPVRSAMHIGTIIKNEFHKLSPRLVKAPNPIELDIASEQLGLSAANPVDPQTDAEKWITIYTYGSRGFSHELVRHGDFSAISQRSTRYCEESESSWTIHPLIQGYLRDTAVPEVDRTFGQEMVNGVMAKARHTYKWWVEKLVPYVADRIKDDPYAKTTARKQARGAARGFLGNALETELIFSANIMQWKHIFRMRAAQAADGEIRVAACAALGALKGSRYGDRFSDLSLVEAGDGTGLMLAGGGAA